MKNVFSFVEGAGNEALTAFAQLGFTISVDDAINEVMYAEMNLNDTDMLGVLAILEDCKRNNLDATLELDGEFYALEEAIEIVDEKASEEVAA